MKIFFISAFALGLLISCSNKVQIKRVNSGSSQNSLIKNSHGGPGGQTRQNDPKIATENLPTLETCTGTDLLPARLWRLSSQEIKETVRTYFGQEAAAEVEKFDDQEVLGFENNYESNKVSKVAANAARITAERMSIRVIRDWNKHVGCQDIKDADMECVSGFIAKFGRKVWKRPLTSQEIARFVTKYEDMRRQSPDAGEGIQFLVEAMLQSPHFLYRSEVGVPDPSMPGRHKLTDFELASLLSYSIWGSAPDELLSQFADKGELSNPTTLESQVKRLLKDERAKVKFSGFMNEWLDLSKALNTPNSEVSKEMRASLYKESMTFIDKTVWEANAPLSTIFSASFSYPDANGAQLYGVASPSTPFTKTQLNASERAGILTQGAFLLAHSKVGNSTSRVVSRGVFLRQSVMCDILGAPPANAIAVANKIAAETTNKSFTARELAQLHGSRPECYGCHSKIDPLGLSFEIFDLSGRFQTMSKGMPIDATATLTDSGTADGTYSNGVDVMHALSKSKQVEECAVRQFYRYSFGVQESPKTNCEIAAVNKAFIDSGHRPSSLLEAITQTKSFLYRSAP